MENIYYILASGMAVTLVSTIGLVLIKSHSGIARYVNKNLTLLTSVSAGVFMVTSYLLIVETLEILSLLQSLVTFGLGIIFYLLLHKVLSPHRHLGEHHTHDVKHSAYKVMIGDSIHNIADGLLLVASYGTSLFVGISTTASIMLHEAPQEISEFLVLKKSGYSNNEAVYRNLATALSIFVGIGIGIFLVTTEILQAYLLGGTATFFLGIVFTDLLPVRQIIKEKESVRSFSAALIGIVVMTLIAMLLGHAHHG